MVNASSKRQLARARRTLWGVASTEDEARAYLQSRLNVFSKAMFWAFIALCVFLGAMFRVYPETSQPNDELIFGGSAVGLALMAVIWRIVLVRRELSLDALWRIDLGYAIGIGAAFAGSMLLLADHLHAASYASLIYACFTVFTRALLVPSSAPRTAVISVVAFIPLWIVGAIIAGTTTQDLPGPAFWSAGFLFSCVAILLATTGSKIIYGLNRKVTEFMQLGQYTLDREIGKGGMGVVYLAHHALLRRATAVKLLSPERVGGADNLDRFEREVHCMSQLTHPNTVIVFDYGRNPDGVFYYAMEYLGDGTNLELLVRKHGALPAGRVAQILGQVCGALQEAHEAGLIHRDIKPANIILCERGGVPDVAKVVDFGLVHEVARSRGGLQNTAQVILGTPHYIAPERITDSHPIGPTVDLYALGAVGYFLLTGRNVFEGKTDHHVCAKHVAEAPTPLSHVMKKPVPPELEAIIMKCLAKSPEQRFASAAALGEALDSVPRTDWTRAEAQAWWRTFRSTQVAPEITALPTMTITVDIGHRR